MSRPRLARTLYSVDLFAGAGGITEGFRQAGFHPLAANDFDVDAGHTFQANFPDTPILVRPIADVPGKELRDLSGVKAGDLDVLLGGPQCQAFSVYNHQRGFHDERSGLFREYLRVVEALAPKVVVMENVTGMTSLDGGRAVDEIHARLSEMGYRVEHRILRAEEYGVPQERRRIVFIASAVGQVLWPAQTHGDPYDLLTSHLQPFVTVADAIGDLPKLAMGEGTDQARPYTRKARTDYQRAMRTGSPGVANHFAPQLAAINLERMKHIPPGGSWRDLPQRLLPAGMKLARRSDHTKRYGRLDPDGLFSTILTKADPHWGAYIHPDQDRTLTVRECARAQSFPDRFQFLGPRGEQFRQVGNAVPPRLAYVIAEAVRLMLKGAESPMRSERRSHIVGA
jgi:DNA (cytosine-5)-methyltransferase 1